MRRPSDGTAGPARWVLGVLGVLLVAALVAVGLLWQQNRELAAARDLEDAEQDATSAASRIAVSMTSYDHRTLEEDFAWIEQDGTGDFEATFSESTEPIRRLIERTEARAEGTVTEAAGDAEDVDHVTVVLFVDQRLRRAGDRRDAVDSSRVVMEMVREGDAWLVDSVLLR